MISWNHFIYIIEVYCGLVWSQVGGWRTAHLFWLDHFHTTKLLSTPKSGAVLQILSPYPPHQQLFLVPLIGGRWLYATYHQKNGTRKLNWPHGKPLSLSLSLEGQNSKPAINRYYSSISVRSMVHLVLPFSLFKDEALAMLCAARGTIGTGPQERDFLYRRPDESARHTWWVVVERQR